MTKYGAQHSKLTKDLYLLETCAKKYIYTNWELVKDWSGLSILLINQDDNAVIYSKGFKVAPNSSYNIPENPISSISNVFYGEIDDSLSMQINGTQWRDIPGDIAIHIADYVYENLGVNMSDICRDILDLSTPPPTEQEIFNSYNFLPAPTRTITVTPAPYKMTLSDTHTDILSVTSDNRILVFGDDCDQPDVIGKAFQEWVLRNSN
jgi:hypothetical protein